MKGFMKVGVGLLVMVLGIAPGAVAEHRAESFTVSPFIGGYVFDSDLDVQNDLTYGLGLGYNFTENLAAEAVFNYTETEVDEGSNDDVHGYLYHVDGLYHFMPDKCLVPYVVAGVGAFGFDGDGDAGNETEFSTNFGAGLKYFITESMALRADVRDVMTYPENTLLYTAGLTFYIGGKEAAGRAEAAETPLDSDGDGVYDDKDKCPNTPAGVKVDAVGCELDSDGDGVYDSKDQCPDTPAGVQVDAVGCELDSDGDGVFDSKDKCPNTPAGACVNEVGCWIVENLHFEFDKAEIQAVYHDGLNKIVSILEKNPQMKIEIQGHTDSLGSDQYNQKLSERRAKAVRDFLVSKGVAKDRLSYKGYGETNPAASNDTEQGRALNRRVELKPLF